MTSEPTVNRLDLRGQQEFMGGPENGAENSNGIIAFLDMRDSVGVWDLNMQITGRMGLMAPALAAPYAPPLCLKWCAPIEPACPL